MSENVGELWALGSNGHVYTENGRLVARFMSEDEAKQAIDDHNLDVELNAPDPPEVVKSREEKRAERLREWREIDPEGNRLHELVISAIQRSMHFLSICAPEFLIAQQIDQAAERIKILQELHPVKEDDPKYD